MLPEEQHTNGYTLQWLDTLVSDTLKPVRSKKPRLLPDDLEKLGKLVGKEIKKIQITIMTTVFSLKDEAKISCTIKKYHSGLIALLDQALEDISGVSGTRHKQALNMIITGIDGLLTLIEQRFKEFLGIDERAPATYFERIKKELTERLELLSGEIGSHETFQSSFEIMKQDIVNFLAEERSYSFRELFYLSDLLNDLGNLIPSENRNIFSKLDEFLISINFNSYAYIQFLTHDLEALINSANQDAERMERMLFYRKEFNQLYRKPDVKFLLKENDLHNQVDNWFKQEISYLEKNNHYSATLVKESGKAARDKGKEKEKIRAKLSVDQMALILRAADDMRVIVARSLSSIFKTIAPYLSTPQKEDISSDSMRSKAYSAELRDKEIAIQTLQQIIDKIKEY